MLKPNDPDRTEEQDQQQLGPGDSSIHLDQYPFIQEFSEFLSTVPTNSLVNKLMTYQQRLLAKALWEAENYGGSESKCIERLKDIYGYHWRQVTKLSDHMAPFREYCEYVLILDHQRQWNARQNVVTVGKIDSADADAATGRVVGRARGNRVSPSTHRRKRLSKL